MTLPGWGLIATSVALVATAFLVRLLPEYARRGAQIAGAVATGLTALVIVARGWGAFAGPLAATMPAWNADIGRYATVVANHLHHHSGQLPVATLLTMIAAMVMAPLPWRRMSLVGGVTLAALLGSGCVATAVGDRHRRRRDSGPRHRRAESHRGDRTGKLDRHHRRARRRRLRRRDRGRPARWPGGTAAGLRGRRRRHRSGRVRPAATATA